MKRSCGTVARGDHLCVKRWKGLYTHHGIDMGDGTVVHFSGEPLRQRHARVVREPLEVFLGGAAPRIVTYRETVRTPAEVAEEALRLLNTQDYHLWRNNCEHFACYCKTGYKQSKQVKRVLAAASITAVSLATLLATVALRQAVRRGTRAPV